MFKTILVTLVAGAALALSAPALAAPAPTLDGESVATATASGAQSKCFYDIFHWNATVNYQASGAASGAYAGTFTSAGSVKLYMGGMTALDGSFSISSPTGSIKGSLQRVDGRTAGSGSCNEAVSDGAFRASGAVYTVTLPDGTIDQGVVELAFNDDPVSGAFTATFRSTSRVADADVDGVLDGADNCPVTPNASQADQDADGIGDMCDLVDDRPALFDDLVAASQAAAIGKALIGKAEHARSAYFSGNVPGACTDLAAYRDGVLSKRGKGIAPATADMLAGKANRIRTIVGC